MESSTGSIAFLAVRFESRRNGVGELLHRHALAALKARGVSVIRENSTTSILRTGRGKPLVGTHLAGREHQLFHVMHGCM